ncbi:stalk domain-containing protein [Brevibacillus ginsengisoli]|uniref:stalk domain-containing protein n=1 Tax=Brevibacillus ginsengisoli TaxID=363854 RepID=UPI003CEEAD60
MKLKQTLAIFLACTVIPTSALAATVPAQPQIHVLYNQKEIVFPDQKPVIRNSRTLVPISPIAKSLGFQVDWNNAKRTVTIKKSSDTIQLVIEQKAATHNGQVLNLDAQPQIINGRTMVPVRFIADALRYQVNWNAAAHQVLIADLKAYGQLGNVTLTADEADKQYKAFIFLLGGNPLQQEPFIEQVFRRKAGDAALYAKYLMATYGSQIKFSTDEVTKTTSETLDAVMTNNNLTEAQMRQEMATIGITDQDIRQLIIYDQFTSAYVKTKLTEQDRQTYYKNHPELSTVASVRHILVDTEDQAKSVISRLNNGEKFVDLAKELSTDPGSNNNGGLYENVPVNNWVKEFRDATLTQPIGQVGQPVKTQFGYHVILVESRSILPYDQVKDQVEMALINEKTNQFRTETLAQFNK